MCESYHAPIWSATNYIFFGKELKADLISQHLASRENMEIAEILFEKGLYRCDTLLFSAMRAAAQNSFFLHKQKNVWQSNSSPAGIYLYRMCIYYYNVSFFCVSDLFSFVPFHQSTRQYFFAH